MSLFKRTNSIVGWLCFAIAAITYLLTMEPNESLWDCGEFIATAFKLEVGHPPGNPIFLLIARFFSMFAFGNTSMVPVMVNIMSALCSAFTILFLFWTITHLARKLVTAKGEELSTGNTIAILGAGFIGAMAYTFSDTFWFSAVEGEVYAMSSLCTAVTFWIILKWEDRVGQPYANRWLILMGYVLGLAIGVHLLNLLTIPAVGLVYYFKIYKPSIGGTIVAFMLSCLVVLGIMIMIPGIPVVASWFELLFVNTFGLPYNSGALFGFLAILGLLFLACYATWKAGRVLLNTMSLFVTLIVIGYSAFALNIIRASANPPVNENNPDNVFSFISYLNRDQYGSAPLLSGRTYATDLVDFKQGSTYVKKDGKYVAIPSTSYVYSKKGQMLFPRMHDKNSVSEYMTWAKLRSKVVGLDEARTLDQEGSGYLTQLPADEAARMNLNPQEPHYQFIYSPSSAENMRFLFNYQFDWMYWRYFFWNFAGRQNDIQGHGGPIYGNWKSGIESFDSSYIQGIKDQPEWLKNNKGNNKYYFIPFILGLIGFAYQLLRGKRQWLVVALLFFFTGLAIVLYLNQAPLQPRERDYAYAGSFYAYAIWIGLAVLALYELLSKAAKSKAAVATATLATVACLPAPLLMAGQNWDDHNRSNRYIARDVAYNYLMSCDPNAILFTVGDNDTFPLWYLQEVEGVRTDVRVTCLSLLAADWYIDGVRVKAYESDPLPITLPRDSYLGEENNSVKITNDLSTAVNLKWLMNFVGNPKNKKNFPETGGPASYIPTRKAILPVNKQQVLASGLVKQKDSALIQDTISFSIPGGYIIKSQLMIYDMLANNDWKRPMHFTSTAGESNIGLKDYLQSTGFTYKLVPIRTPASANDLNAGRMDTEWTYNYLMNTCQWGNMNNPKVYIDYFYITTLVRVLNIRGMYANLAQQLITEGEAEKAKQVLDRVMELMPEANFPYCSGNYLNDMSIVNIADLYYKVGETEKAKALSDKIGNELLTNARYFYTISQFQSMEMQVSLFAMQDLYHVAKEHGNADLQKQLEDMLKSFGLIS